MKTLLILIFLCKTRAAATKNLGEFRGIDNEQHFAEQLRAMNNASNHEASNNETSHVVNPSCTYPDYYCNPTGPDLIRKAEHVSIDNARDCLELCKQ